MKIAILVLAALISATCWAADPKAAKYYEDALSRYEKKDLPGAIIQLRNALQIDKSMLPVQLLLGKALILNGEVAAAEVALLEAMRLGVNRAEIVIPLAQAYLAQGKHKQLFDQPQMALAGLPSAVQLQLLLLRSTAYADLGNMRDALQAVTDARAIDARSPDVWLAEVPIRIRARQFKEAKLAVGKAIVLAPDSAEAWYQKASVAHAAGDLKEALSAYDRVIKLNSSHIEARVARAGLYVDMGKSSDAARDLDELKKNSPQEPRAAYLRALLAEQNNKQQESRDALREVTGFVDPVPIDFIRYRPQILLLNALAHYGLAETEKAKNYLEAFQRVQPNTPAAKLLAQLYLGESRADRAIEVLEAYLKEQPHDGQAMVLLGSALMTKGQNARAMSYMKQALQTRDAPEFRTILGLTMIQSGQAKGAIPELEAALKQNPAQVQAALGLISLYLRNGQTAEAVGLAEKLVKQQPSKPEFFNLLGVAKRQAGKLVEARSAFEQALKLDARMASPKLNLASMEIADKAYDAADMRLGAILKADDKNAEAMYEMAVLSERRGQLPEAQRWLEKAVDSGAAKEVRWPLALSDFQLRHGRPGPALEAAKVAYSRAPENLLVLLALARVQLANNDSVNAKTTLNTATRVAEFNAAMQVQIAMLQLGANNATGAAYCLDKALSAKPDYLPAQALMAEVELRQGEIAKADKRARSILDKYPDKAIGHGLMGDIALAGGRLAEAQAAYKRAYQVEPSSDTLLRLYRSLRGKDDKAARILVEGWIKTHPRDLAALRVAGESQARAGDNQAARKSYETLIKLNPDDGDALNSLANILFRLKDPEAVKVAEQAVAKSPGNAYAIDTLGWLLYQNGEQVRSLQMLRDARLRVPDSPIIRYHLGAALVKAGRGQEAREELEAALTGATIFEGSEEAAILLKSLK